MNAIAFPAPEASAAARPITVRVPEACRLIGIKRSKLYELIEDGSIPIIKVGAMTLIRVSVLEAFIDAAEATTG